MVINLSIVVRLYNVYIDITFSRWDIAAKVFELAY